MNITNAPQLDNASVRLQDHDHGREYYRRTPSAYQHIPEASGLTWIDSFYDGAPGIIAVFDRDTARAANVDFKSYSCVIAFFLFWAFYGVFDFLVWSSDMLIFAVQNFLVAAVFGYGAWRGRQFKLAQHVAITDQGIRVDMDHHLATDPFRCLRLSCPWLSCIWLPSTGLDGAACIIPFNQIQKVTLSQYQFCCHGDPNLHIATVHYRGHHQFGIYGIVRPHEFVDLVMALKESSSGAPTASTQPQTYFNHQV